jgi:hypothetical protein
MAKRRAKGAQPRPANRLPMRVTYQRAETGETWANDSSEPMPDWLKQYAWFEPRATASPPAEPASDYDGPGTIIGPDGPIKVGRVKMGFRSV